MLVIPYLGESTFLTIISGIECSGIAAAAMTVFLQRVSEIKEKERVNSKFGYGLCMFFLLSACHPAGAGLAEHTLGHGIVNTAAVGG